MSAIEEVTVVTYDENNTDPVITLDSTPTSGNLLLALHGYKSDWFGSQTIPSYGWTDFSNWANSNNFLGCAGYKISDGTETALGFEQDDSTNFATGSDHMMIVVEISGITAAELIDSSINAASIGTSVTSCATGSATPTGDGTAIVIWSARPGNGFDPIAYSDSFAVANDGTDDAAVAWTFSGDRVIGGIAVKDFTGTTAQSCTVSTTDTGGFMWAAVLVFQPAASGSIIPQASHYYRMMQG